MIVPLLRISAVLVLGLAGYSATAAAQDAVARQPVRLHVSPSASAPSRGTVPAGATLNVLRGDTVNGFIHVETLRERPGWVAASRIRITTPPVTLMGMAVAPPLATAEPGGVPGTFDGCPVQGDAKLKTVRALNVLKNRVNVPAAGDIDPAVNLHAVLQPGDDRVRWNSARAAVLTGFVVKVDRGGFETSTCHKSAEARIDTHIDLVLAPADSSDEMRHVVVEVTPRWRPSHPAWTTHDLRQSLLHHWVRFTGWLLFDAEHADESKNTAPHNAADWRATSWELHPVTGIEVLPGPPSP